MEKSNILNNIILENQQQQQSPIVNATILNSINTPNINLSLNDEISQAEKEKLAELEIKNLLDELKAGQSMTAGSQIKRLLNTNFISPYEVLNVPGEATDEEIKRQFRQLTLLLHPDKCSDPKAVEAFHGKFIFKK